MCTAVAIGAGALGTGYSIYSGLQNAKAANAAASQQASNLNALTQLSAQQWANYKENYKPVIEKAVKMANRRPDYAGAEAAAAKSVTAPAVAAIRQNVSGALSRGLAPTSGTVQSALRNTATRAGVAEGLAKTDARNAANDTAFNNRMGIVTTGRGLPGQIMSGYGSLAGQAGNLAAQYSQLAGSNFNSAIRFLGLGG